jgi:DNA-binding Lrp family transcriptional regulator
MSDAQRQTETRQGRDSSPVSVVGTPLPLSALEKCLLNEYQRGFPLTAAPFAEIAGQLGVSETDVIDTLKALQQRGLISRVGPVFTPRKAGASTLAAMAVPQERLESVAAQVSRYDEVNHNYQREHVYNLWFVVTAADQVRVQQVLDEIEVVTGIAVLDLPLERSFYIDLGFPLWC